MPPLAKQEMRVARMLVAGLRQPEIAHELGIAPSTVKTHIARIRTKTGFDRRTHAVSFEVFLYELLREQPVRPLERGVRTYEALVRAVEHVAVLRDAVRLVRAGYPDWTFHQSYHHAGEHFSEWLTREGIVATVRRHRELTHRGIEILLDDGE